MPRTLSLHTAQLSERLTIQTETRVALGGGSSTVTLVDAATVRARIRPMKGREYLQARQVIGGTPYEVTIRYPLPTGVTLTGDTPLKWLARTGTVPLYATSPPSLTEDHRFLVFTASTKEGA